MIKTNFFSRFSNFLTGILPNWLIDVIIVFTVHRALALKKITLFPV